MWLAASAGREFWALARSALIRVHNFGRSIECVLIIVISLGFRNVPGNALRSEFENLNATRLFRRYECARCSYTLPCALELNPGIDESFAVDVWFAFLRTLDSEHPNDDSDIPINLDSALLGDCLGWLIVRRLDTRQKFAL